MKHLSQFFDTEAFFAGKELTVTGKKEYQDYDTKKHLGTIVEVVITKDDTPYRQKDGEHVTNLLEKLSLKVNKDIVDVPMGAQAIPVNPICSVYGDYRDKLSIVCEDIKFITSPAQSAQSKQPLQPTQPKRA